MGLLQEIEDRLLAKIAQLFDPILKPLKKLFSAVKSFFTALIDLIPESIQLFKLVTSEILAWRYFKENLNFKTGVINLQSARERIEQLITEVIDAWHALIDLWKGAKLNPLDQINEASESLAEVVAEFEHIAQFAEFLKRVGPKLEKMGGKVFEVLAIIQQVAEILLDTVRKLSTIVTAIKDVRETFQTGKGLFLPQTNARKVVDLSDGSSMRIRVGNLH